MDFSTSMNSGNEGPSFKLLKQYVIQKEELQKMIIQRDAQIQMLLSQLEEKSQPMDMGQLKSEIEHLSDKLKTINESQIASNRQVAETNRQFESVVKESVAKCERFTSQLQKFEDKNATELDEKDEEIAQLKEENIRLQKMAENLIADNVRKDRELSHVQLRLKSVEGIYHKLTDIIEHTQKQSHHQSKEVVNSNRKRSATGSSNPVTRKVLITEQHSEAKAETNHKELPNSPAHQDNEDDYNDEDDSIDDDVQMDGEKWSKRSTSGRQDS